MDALSSLQRVLVLYVLAFAGLAVSGLLTPSPRAVGAAAVAVAASQDHIKDVLEDAYSRVPELRWQPVKVFVVAPGDAEGALNALDFARALNVRYVVIDGDTLQPESLAVGDRLRALRAGGTRVFGLEYAHAP